MSSLMFINIIRIHSTDIIFIVVLGMMFGLLAEILRISDDDFRVLFSDGRRLSTSELNCTLSYVASGRS